MSQNKLAAHIQVFADWVQEAKKYVIYGWEDGLDNLFHKDADCARLAVNTKRSGKAALSTVYAISTATYAYACTYCSMELNVSSSGLNLLTKYVQEAETVIKEEDTLPPGALTQKVYDLCNFRGLPQFAGIWTTFNVTPKDIVAWDEELYMYFTLLWEKYIKSIDPLQNLNRSDIGYGRIPTRQATRSFKSMSIITVQQFAEELENFGLKVAYFSEEYVCVYGSFKAMKKLGKNVTALIPSFTHPQKELVEETMLALLKDGLNVPEAVNTALALV